MNADLREIGGQRCVVLDGAGDLLRSEDDARALVEEALSEGAEWVVVPVSRLDPAFFVLRSGVAGALLQKLVVYHLRIAIVGDVSEHTAASGALRDFIIECNRGADIWFVDDMEALPVRLVAHARTSS